MTLDIKIDLLIKSLLPENISENEYAFLKQLITNYFNGIRYSNRVQVEKLGIDMGLMDLRKIKELTELSIVIIARKIAHKTDLTYLERFNELVDLYQSQVNISLRTVESIRLQQYSTPITIGFLAGMFCEIDKHGNYFEPSAGNGALTILGNPYDFYVNEIDDNRISNLQLQGFKNITNNDANDSFDLYQKKFDAVLTNPPFGSIENELIIDGYTIKGLEMVMSIHALNCMKDDGKCAIIIGGNTEFDKDGLIKFGKNRTYFLYLFKHYNVIDVINIDGSKLYSRQGTSFNTRLILIDGRKENKNGTPFKKNDLPPNETMSQSIVSDFMTLFNRIEKSRNLLSNVNLNVSESNIDRFDEKTEMKNNKESYKKELSKWLKIGISPIDVILEKLEPFLNDLMGFYKSFFEKRDWVWNDRVEKSIRLDIIFDLVKSLSKNLKESDEIINVNFRTGLNGNVIISFYVLRDGVEYSYSSEVIRAGGWNIQKEHFRYIVHTNLPKTELKKAIDIINKAKKKMKKEERIREDISRYEKYIFETKKELELLKLKTDEQIWDESGNEKYGIYNPENTYFKSKEHHAEWFNEIKENTKKSHNRKIQYLEERIKHLRKEKQKQEAKLKELEEQ